MLDWQNKDTRRIMFTMASFGALLVIGTFGYRIFSDDKPSLFDCLYMTVITVSTIGYSEVVNISHSTSGRLFTMFIAISGIGLLAYLLSQITAYVIEGHLKINLINRKIEKWSIDFTDITSFVATAEWAVASWTTSRSRATLLCSSTPTRSWSFPSKTKASL